MLIPIPDPTPLVPCRLSQQLRLLPGGSPFYMSLCLASLEVVVVDQEEAWVVLDPMAFTLEWKMETVDPTETINTHRIHIPFQLVISKSTYQFLHQSILDFLIDRARYVYYFPFF